MPVSEEIEYKSVIFRPSKGLISYGADSAELTKNEMQILSVLLKNAGKIVSRDEFMDELWQSDEFVDDNTPVSYTHLDVYKRQDLFLLQ